MSDIPAYVNMKRLCHELGRSDETIRRWQRTEGFPMPKRHGLYEWAEVKKHMDGRGKPSVSSRPRNQLEEIRDAHQAYQAGRTH